MPGGSGSLLRRNASFRLLWTARATSYLGESLGLVALLVHMQGIGGGAALAAALLLLAVDFVPGLFGAFAGAVADRFDLRTVMIACEFVQAALTAVLAVGLPPLPVLLALVAVRGLAAQVYLPASRSAVPLLVDDRDVESANSVLGAGTYGLEAAGPLVAAALFTIFDVSGLLMLTAVTYVLAAVLLRALPPLPAVPDDHQGVVAAVRTGVRHLWADRTVRAITIGFCGVVVFSGVDDVALVFLGKDTLHGSDAQAATLYAGVGIGLAIGYPLLARYASRVAMLPLLIAGFAVSSAGNLLTGLAPVIMAALAIQVIRGLGLSALDVAVNTHLQRTVPRAVLGRVFGTIYGLVGVAGGVSYLLGGILLDATNARVTFVVAGVAALAVTAVLGIVLLRQRA